MKTYDPSLNVPPTGTPEKTESDMKLKDPSEEELNRGQPKQGRAKQDARQEEIIRPVILEREQLKQSEDYVESSSSSSESESSDRSESQEESESSGYD